MVFNSNGGYTKNASDLHDEINLVTKDIILKYMDERDMTIEEIVYVVDGCVEKTCLRNQIGKRAKLLK